MQPRAALLRFTLPLLLAGGLAHAAPKPTRAQLIAQLDDPDVEVAAQAATALGDVAEAHGALAAALDKAPPARIAKALVASLAQRPAAGDAARIVRYARHRNAEVRAATVTALARYASDAAAQDAIRDGLHDDVAAVRAAATAAVATAKLRTAIDPLIQLVGRGEPTAATAIAAIADREVVAKLAGQIGKLPDAALVSVFAAILQARGPDAVRVEVVAALAQIQDASAIEALTAYVSAAPRSPSRADAEKAIADRGAR